MPEEKVVIVLSKEEAEKYLNYIDEGEVENFIFVDVNSQIRNQLKELNNPKPDHKTLIGSTGYESAKMNCPRCGYQVFPTIIKCECIDCKWSGTDNELVYRAEEQGGVTYGNHCPDCNSTKIKRLKDGKKDGSA